MMVANSAKDYYEDERKTAAYQRYSAFVSGKSKEELESIVKGLTAILSDTLSVNRAVLVLVSNPQRWRAGPPREDVEAALKFMVEGSTQVPNFRGEQQGG